MSDPSSLVAAADDQKVRLSYAGIEIVLLTPERAVELAQQLIEQAALAEGSTAWRG